MYVATKELPDALRAALRDSGYAKPDVSIEAKATASAFDAGGQGRKGFVVLVDLATGATQRHDGSWGGANIANESNVVDRDARSHPLAPNVAVINGSEGYGGVLASITIHPSNAAKLLHAAGPSLDATARGILYAYGAIKSGTYRRDALNGVGVKDAETDPRVKALIELGLLKRDGRGIQITTEGKNVRKSAVRET